MACGICGKEGHNRRTCTSKVGKARGNNAGGRAPRKCGICGRTGHDRRSHCEDCGYVTCRCESSDSGDDSKYAYDDNYEAMIIFAENQRQMVGMMESMAIKEFGMNLTDGRKLLLEKNPDVEIGDLACVILSKSFLADHDALAALSEAKDEEVDIIVGCANGALEGVDNLVGLEQLISLGTFGNLAEKEVTVSELVEAFSFMRKAPLVQLRFYNEVIESDVRSLLKHVKDKAMELEAISSDDDDDEDEEEDDEDSNESDEIVVIHSTLKEHVGAVGVLDHLVQGISILSWKELTEDSDDDDEDDEDKDDDDQEDDSYEENLEDARAIVVFATKDLVTDVQLLKFLTNARKLSKKCPWFCVYIQGTSVSIDQVEALPGMVSTYVRDELEKDDISAYEIFDALNKLKAAKSFTIDAHALGFTQFEDIRRALAACIKKPEGIRHSLLNRIRRISGAKRNSWGLGNRNPKNNK